MDRIMIVGQGMQHCKRWIENILESADLQTMAGNSGEVVQGGDLPVFAFVHLTVQYSRARRLRHCDSRVTHRHLQTEWVERCGHSSERVCQQYGKYCGANTFHSRQVQ